MESSGGVFRLCNFVALGWEVEDLGRSLTPAQDRAMASREGMSFLLHELFAF